MEPNDLVDEPGKIGGDVLEGLVVHQVHRLDLERFDKALRFGVVVWVATPPHRADQPVLGEQLAIVRRGVLRAADALMFVKHSMGR